jgi:hypothetical protein
MESSQQQANDAVYSPVTSVFSVWESAFKEAAALAKQNMAGAQAAIDSSASRTVEGASALSDAASSTLEDAAEASHMAGGGSAQGRSGPAREGGEGQPTPDDRRGKRK